MNGHLHGARGGSTVGNMNIGSMNIYLWPEGWGGKPMKQTDDLVCFILRHLPSGRLAENQIVSCHFKKLNNNTNFTFNI